VASSENHTMDKTFLLPYFEFIKISCFLFKNFLQSGEEGESAKEFMDVLWAFKSEFDLSTFKDDVNTT